MSPLTASDIRRFVALFEERCNQAVNEDYERAYKKEWIRRGKAAMRGEIELPPIGLGLMSDWKYEPEDLSR
jgi:hypothetical protein